MKKLIIVGLVMLLMVGCANTRDLSAQVMSNTGIKEKAESLYADVGDIAGFMPDEQPNLYNTLWLIKIMNFLGIEIDNKRSIGQWANSIDILDDQSMEDIGLNGLPLEVRYVFYLDLLNELGLELPSDVKNQMVETLVSMDLTSITNTRSYYLADLNEKLGYPIPDFENIVRPAVQSGAAETYVINESSTIKEISDAFKLKVERNVNRISDIKFTVEKEFADGMLHNLISFGVADPQVVYQVLYTGDYKVTSAQKAEIGQFINAIMLKDQGWGNLSTPFDLDNTYFALEIYSVANALNELNSDGINRYLVSYFYNNYSNKKELTTLDIINLRTLTLCFSILHNKPALNEVKKIITQKLNTVDASEVNAQFMDALLAINMSLGEFLEFNNLSPELQESIFQLIDKLNQKELKYFNNVYHLYLLKAFTKTLSGEEVSVLKTFINADGGLAGEKGDVSQIGDTYYFLKLAYYLDMELPDNGKMIREFYNEPIG
jgi:hypothetical protein